ncbi:MAG: toll/interleukin-1 receptor domain-containing protein [Flavobacteriales bacterium]|nr:toll/interleukin-1 receptor domain-containing protein [Flavobacteriales bacterium]
MPITREDILAYRATEKPSATVLLEAKRRGEQTGFLCHSHKDRDLAKRLQAFLADKGFRLYIDWEDPEMPSTPDRVTAERIQNKIEKLDWFLYLATANAGNSRWCPWEIGYADGVKDLNDILVIPTRDGDTTHGAEYLRLYNHLDFQGIYRSLNLIRLNGTLVEARNMCATTVRL